MHARPDGFRALPAALLIGLVVAARASEVRAQAQPADSPTDRVIGVVRDSAGRAVAGATIIITRGPDRSTERVATDSLGGFSVAFTPGTGDYLIYATTETLGTARLRVRRGEPGLIEPAVLRLSPAAARLQPVVVATTRPRPPRGQPIDGEPGAAPLTVEGLGEWTAGVRPDDLNAQLASLGGVLSTDGALTVAGLSSQAHQVTLNGSAVSLGALPSLARARLRLATGTVDPAQGGFSGAQVQLEMSPGGNFGSRRIAAGVAGPALPGANAASSWMTRQPREEVSLNGASDGAIVYDRIFYSMAGQVTAARRRTLLDAGAAGASALSRVDRALAGISEGWRVNGGDEGTIDGSGVLRLDRTPRGRHASQVTAFARVFGGVHPDDALSTASRSMNRSGYGSIIQGSHSSYVGTATLNEVRASLSMEASALSPRTFMPEGRVVLGPEVDARLQGSMLFGGTGGGSASERRRSLELVNETSRYAGGSTHRLRMAIGGRIDDASWRHTANVFGTYHYRTLADLESNRPVSYTRALEPASAGVTQGSAFVGLSDHWRLQPAARVLYGVRMDWRPSVSSVPGANGGVALSPRVGFTWAYRSPKRPEPPARGGAMGIFAARPHGVLRGSFGRYTGRPDSHVLLQAAAYGGGRPRLRCVGEATPRPDWSALIGGTAAPTSMCEGPELLIDSNSVAYRIDGGLRGVDGWRGTLGWSGAWRGLSVSGDGTVSWTSRMVATIPTERPRTPAFFSRPDDRPVYVPRDAIDPASGLLTPYSGLTAQPTTLAYAERGAGRSSQLTMAVAPFVANVTSHHWALSYTLARSSVTAHGIGHPGAAGSPRGEWIRARGDVRHTFVAQLGRVTRSGLSLVMLSRTQSGMPYTPLIAGDVDGDGIPGDRAFAIPVAGGSDEPLHETFRTAAAATTGAGRACIAQAEGRIAGINSCRTPWSVNATLVAKTQKGIHRRLPVGDRVSAMMYVDNVVSLVDRAVNGRRLAGWGGNADIDPVLLRVAGFDPASDAFIYEPNRAFGRPTGTAPSSQYRVGLTVSVDLSQPVNAQALRRFLSPGRGRNPGPRLTADTIAARFSRTVMDVYQAVLQHGDSLLLRGDQTDSLLRWRPGFQRAVDDVWMELGRSLASQGDPYDAGAALARTDEATDKAWAIAQDHARRILHILDPLQRELVPRLVHTLGTASSPVRVRTTTAW